MIMNAQNTNKQCHDKQITTVEQWPIEYGSQLILGNLQSNISICCLWGRRDRIARSVDPSLYCLIGNLYSRAGINSILRNILANPMIRCIALAGKSLTDSDDALLKFFSLGVDQDWKVIENGAQIDPNFPYDILAEVRKSVDVIDLRSCRNFASEFYKVSATFQNQPPFMKPRYFAKTTPVTQVYPSEFSGFVVRQQSIVEAWEEIIWTIMTFGKISPTDYGLNQSEILSLLSIIQNPKSNPNNLPNWAPFTKTDIANYVNKFFTAEKKQDVAYDYGDRILAHWGENQIDNMIAELQHSRHSRRAMVLIWDPRTDARSTSPPCIVNIQAVVREKYLHLSAYIRSNDIFRAYPLNAFALAALQEHIASQLRNVKIGSLSILSFSAHIYSDCWDACERAAFVFGERKRTFQQDPRGNFVFRLANGQVSADHYSPAGDLLQTIIAPNVGDLGNAIMPFVGRVDHSMYLTRELMKLQLCQASGEPYIQDRI